MKFHRDKIFLDKREAKNAPFGDGWANSSRCGVTDFVIIFPTAAADIARE